MIIKIQIFCKNEILLILITILHSFIMSACSPVIADLGEIELSGVSSDWILYNPALINSSANTITGNRITPKQLYYDNGLWSLLYQGHYPKGSGRFDRTNLPALAYSVDFLEWQDEPLNPIWDGVGPIEGWEGNRAMPEGFLTIEGQYYLYYGGQNPEVGMRAIGVAIGDSLFSLYGLEKPVITVNDNQEAWNRDRVYCRGLYSIEGLYYMAVSGGKQYSADEQLIEYSMGIYISKDGINWEEIEDNPVLRGKPGSWYESSVLPKSPTNIDGKWYLAFESFIYNDKNEIIGRGIGLAVSEKIIGPWLVITENEPIIDTRNYEAILSDIEHPILFELENTAMSKEYKYGLIAAVVPAGKPIRGDFSETTLALWVMK